MTITKGVVTPNKLSSSVLKACGLGLLATTLGFTSNNLYAANGNGVQSAMQHEHTGRGQVFKQNQADTQAKKNQLEQQTLALAATMGELRRANKGAGKGGKDKFSPAFEQQLEELVTARQASQYALLQLDANAALRTVMPNAKRTGMPAHIEAKLAQQAELVGQLEFVYEDSDQAGQIRLSYYLTSANNKVQLFVPDSIDTELLQSGAQVRVKGWQFDNGEQENVQTALVLGEEQASLEVLAAGSDTSSTSTSTQAALTGTIGEQKVLVLMLNFQDNPVKPWTTQEVEEMVFGRVNDYYKEASYGQTWLSGDVRGYYTMPIDTTCSYLGMDKYAMQAAKDNGIDLSQYKRLVYMLPKNNSCSWQGQGTVGGSPSKAWINGELNLKIIGHELGHGLGLRHAKRLNCGNDVNNDLCSALTYGDSLDIMGRSEGHFNVFNKERLGWLTAERGEIITANAGGSYQLEPYEQVSSGQAKGLKVRRGTDAATGEPLWYYLEYRQGTGFDSFLAGKPITEGVLMHYNKSEDDINSSILMDMTPGSSIYDQDDAALVAGKSYNDAVAGVTITTQWADSSGVGVNISYSGHQTCTAAQPSLALASSSSVWAEAGETVSYRATLTNNDSAECGSSNYNVSAQVASGWNSTQQTVSLAPGQSTTVSLSVTSSTTATEGFYDVTIKGVNTSDSRYQASTVASYVVEAPVAACVSANPQWTLQNTSSTQVAAGTTVTYQGTLTNKDADSCAASTFDVKASLPAGWKATSPSATLAPGQSQTLNVSVTSAADANAGVYDFSLVAVNRNNGGYQSSASATYQVAAPVASCKLAAPKLVVANAQGAEVDAGTVQGYNVEITNQNQDCGDATYNLSIATPSGWSASNSSVTLASGTTTTVSVSVMSATSANAGSYNLTLTAKDVANTAYSSTSTLVYRVAQQQNNAPVAYSDSVSMASKTAIYINVLGNDKDIDGDTLVVKSATQGAKGSVQVLSDGRIKYTPAKNFKNGDNFSYTISDGQLESTATVNVTLAGGSTGGGGNKGKGKN
ncbi:NEW3 domain-containing protein [Pseudoalteromonas sp. T1lg10]|uniref:NEW3 domain-containing protein n=1 Tax=Pseudoalteromonas sp. T1lg10 TaxID=2077093 RepID=UPI001319D008|nr:NEW3 domain-containing protein [Pseudoalteromonas sp. T1lg10]